MTINVFYLKNFQIKCILNPSIEKFIKCISLNTGRSKELAVFYEQEVLIFDIEEESIIEKFKCPDAKFLEFNNDNKLLILTKDSQLIYYDLLKKKPEQIKTVDKVTVAKWYPFNSVDLAYSTSKGISYHSLNNKNRISGIDLEIKEGNYICELSWYTLDENYKYVLVGLFDGHSYLLDLMQSIIIMKFEKFGQEITSLIWLRHEPGTFLSFNSNSGRVALWNVSKKNHNEITKFSDSPIIRCIPLSDPTRILFTLENGSVVIYDVKNRKKVFILEPSHSETIFDLKYNPLSYGIFASCSYESSIKIWDLTKNKIIWDLKVDYTVNRLSGGKKSEDEATSHIFSIKWSPVDKDLIASGDSKGYLRIWDITKRKLISSVRMNNSPDAHAIGLDWDDNNKLISTCIDCIYILKYDHLNAKLTLIKSFKSPSVSFQIKFNPFEQDQFAVACLDNSIKIYTELNERPVNILTGHTRKVFGLAFNPNIKGVLASTSDDCKIGIWNLEKKSNFFLEGHTKNTRHLIWLKEFTNLVISGSWDGNIKIWNVDMATCIGEISEHYSDVYGIDISPNHPFLLTSCSRDNSIRFFNLLTTAVKSTEIILSFDEIDYSVFNNEHKNLELGLRGVISMTPIVTADMISNYFYYCEGLKDFWDIIKVITKNKEYCNQDNKIFFVSDLYSAYKSRVQHLEFSYYSKTKIDYSIKKEEVLKEAIDLCAKASDWEKFCELSIANNEWEKAIMAAPNISISYWKELTSKYAEYCSLKNTPDKKFASLLSNKIQPALKFFIESGDYEDAKIIWLTRETFIPVERSRNNSYLENCDSFFPDENVLKSINLKLDNLSEEDGLFRTAYYMAKEYLIQGFPILAAASFISIKDIYNCLKCLVRTGSLEIAYMVMKIFNLDFYEDDIMIGLLLKELRKGKSQLVKTIISKTSNIDKKITLCLFMKNYKNIKTNIFDELNMPQDEMLRYLQDTQNHFLFNLLTNDVNASIKLFYDVTDALAIYLSKNKEVECNLIETTMKYMFYIKGIDMYLIENHQKFIIRLLIVSSFVESLNNNIKSCSFYLTEINRIATMRNIKIDDNEAVLLQYSNTFIKGEKSNFGLSIDINKFVKESSNKNINCFKDYIKIQHVFKKTGNKFVLKYHCDDIGYFYCLPEEIFPVNISKNSKSSLNGKKIRGAPIKIKNILFSASQGMEWFKFISTCPQLDEYELFNAY